MKKHKKKIIWGIIILITVGVIWQKYFRSSDKEELESFVVKKGSVEKTLSVSGNIEPKEYVDLSFEAPALVSRVEIKVGDKVEKGQILMQLDKSSLVANVREAEISVEQAIESEKLARRKWDDYKPEEREKIKKTVEQTKFKLSAVRSQLYKGTLISPIDGIVTKLDVRKGELAQGVVVRIISEEQGFEVEALVSEADVVELFENQKAEVTLDALGSDEKFSAKVSHIDPEAMNIQDVVYFRTLFEMDEIDERVRSGMTVDIDILVSKKENVNVIPLRFVRRDDEGSYVFVKSKDVEEAFSFFGKKDDVENSAEKRYVKTGIEGDDGLMEIIDGIGEGKIVILIYEEE
ncbi:MAG: efflux RND transporter periplasmic adaptor subunit [Candidatus Moranbacteria bacterium]|nr:efflux RND transporter periplasmic adaptor subunit [Candidatus Moranbacteria bacterium]